MQVIKAVLIIVGIFILAGFVFVGYVAYERATGTGYFGTPHASQPAPATTPVAAVAVPALLKALNFPEGSRVEAMQAVGNRAVLVVRPVSGSDRIVILDPAAGTITGSITLGPLPAPPEPR